MKWNQLDLEIQLSPSQAVGKQAMIEKFISRKQHYFCQPVLEGSVLKINSSDFVNFLELAELSNEFDWFRLRQAAVKAIGEAKKRKRDPIVTRHYQKLRRDCPRMRTINRTVLIITAKQPMIDWLGKLPDRMEEEISNPITLEEVNQDSPAYLIPEYDSEYETLDYIEHMKPDYFELILSDWTTDKRLWPRPRSVQLFDRWFSVQFHTVVYDMDQAVPIEYEEA